MGSYTHPSAGGGQIYQDGKPVSVQLADSESTTVPAGETWVVTVTIQDNAHVTVNGQRVADGVGGFQMVLKDGDTIKANSGGTNVSGWSV